MPYAYLDTSDDVLAVSTTEYTLAQAQAILPAITTVVSNAPAGLLVKESPRVPPRWSRLTSGDGTSIGDYTEQPAYGIYTYSVAGDTANGAVAADRLTEEINDSAIADTLVYVGVKGDVLTVYFDEELSSGDETILDGLVAAHSGNALRPLTTVSIDPPLEPVVPGASKVVANDRPAIEINTGVTGWAAEWNVWPLEQFTQAQVRVRVQFILKESGTGSNVRIAARAKAQSAGEDSSASFADTQFVVVPVTYTTVGEVFEATLWLDASSFEEGDSVALQVGRDGDNTLGSGTDDDANVAVQLISVCVKGR